MNEITAKLFHRYGGLVASFFLASVAAAVMLGYAVRKFHQAGALRYGQAPTIPFSSIELITVLLFLVSGVFFSAGTTLALAAILLLVRFHRLDFGIYFGTTRLSVWKNLGVGFWIALAADLPLRLAAALAETVAKVFGVPAPPQPAVELFLRTHNWPSLLLLLFFILILAPFGEEVLFRGFLYVYLKNRLPRRTALVLTALLFAVLHFNWPTFLPLFLFGLLLGIAYELSGSLLLSIAIHCWFNSFTTGFLLLAKFG
ncbi:CPBP family intramembrane glutamic endopeptidase [Methylacidimicrobium sp. AP8]|uniref:CPBP family intramembrane glutamic endopeptidase n=1 Tax=Methylacidimicrobium sp. AP8 TaxID=2730359 RepID=UPI0019248207|nr:CPBP family intramembrane glutamic endopeptidase [Methylacidimicrobium sp. AP8]